MASRFRSMSRPTFSLLRSSISRSGTSAVANAGSQNLSCPRISRGMCSLQSLLPLHSAVSSARLTTRLGVDSAAASRSLYQGTLCRSIPGS